MEQGVIGGWINLTKRVMRKTLRIVSDAIGKGRFVPVIGMGWQWLTPLKGCGFYPDIAVLGEEYSPLPE